MKRHIDATCRQRGAPRTWKKIPLTAAGYKKLDEELKHLKSVERPSIIRANIQESTRAWRLVRKRVNTFRQGRKQSFIEGLP